MYLHTAFGLTIESPFILPAEMLHDLAPMRQVDISVECQESLDSRRYSFSQECSVSTAPGEIVMRWEDVSEFRLYNGEKLIIRPRPAVSTDILNLFISGSVFAMMLFQRGMTILHGSVVAVEGQGVAFLAPKGVGKSTLALAMRQIGATLISDDIVAIPTTSPFPMVTTGFAQAKLWPDSLSQLGYTVHHHTKLRDEVEKRGVALSFGEQKPVPLRQIFILGKGRELTLLPLNKNHALLTLLPHWYLARYGTAMVKQLEATALQFSQCRELVEKVQVAALVRPESLTELQSVAEAVWDYVMSGEGPSVVASSEARPHVSMVGTK